MLEFINQVRFVLQLPVTVDGMVSCGIRGDFLSGYTNFFFMSHKPSQTSETRMHYTMC
jgi:hypothetical protein